KKDGIAKVYVVVGQGKRAGQIKTLYIGRHVCPPQLVPVWGPGGQHGGNLQEVHLKGEFQDARWVFLADAYEAEGRIDDWSEWLDYQDACAKGITTAQFPEELLPQRVVDCRNAAARYKDQWQPKKNRKNTPTQPSGGAPIRRSSGRERQPTASGGGA